MWHFPCPGGRVGECKDTIRLNENWYGNERNDDRLRQDRFALESEQECNGSQKADHRQGFDTARKGGHRFLTPALLKGITSQNARHQGNDHIERNRQEQRLPRHGDIRDSQQESDNRCEGKHHDRIIHTDLNQCVIRVATCQM